MPSLLERVLAGGRTRREGGPVSPPLRKRFAAVLRTLSQPRPRLPAFEEPCFVCGAASSTFLVASRASVLREAVCASCRASKRNSDVARVVLEAVGVKAPVGIGLRGAGPHIAGFDLLCTQSSGAMVREIGTLPGVVLSEYWEEVEPGSVWNGIRCEDLTALTFEDASLDLVISEDVLEHVPDPRKALAEVRRVLRPGGSFIFSVPQHTERRTQTRATMDADGRVHHLLEPVFHAGFEAHCTVGGAWYGPAEQTWIATRDDHAAYERRLRAAAGRHGLVYRYDSRVWRARRPEG